MCTRFPYWLCRNAQKFVGQEESWAIKSLSADFNLNVLIDTYDYSCF